MGWDLGEDSEEREDYTSRHPPLGVNVSNHRLSTLAMGSYAEQISPLGWLED